MDKVARYKVLFEKGLLTKEKLEKLKKSGVLTENEVKEIIGGTENG